MFKCIVWGIVFIENLKYLNLRADRERGRIALKEAMELQIVTKSFGLARN